MKYTIVAQTRSREAYEEVGQTSNWKAARNFAELGCHIFVGEKEISFLGGYDRMLINEAIDVLSFYYFGDFNYYLASLFTDEVIEEMSKVKEAKRTAELYCITDEQIRKHYERYMNAPEEPTRFIDRPHFKAIDTNELPF